MDGVNAREYTVKIKRKCIITGMMHEFGELKIVNITKLQKVQAFKKCIGGKANAIIRIMLL